jgi:hypothetical protein
LASAFWLGKHFFVTVLLRRSIGYQKEGQIGAIVLSSRNRNLGPRAVVLLRPALLPSLDLELAIERRHADSQHAGRFLARTFEFRQGRFDVFPLLFLNEFVE